MSQFLKRVAIYLVFSFALFLMLSYLMPVLYRIMPSDYKRHLVLTENLNKDTKAEIIFFGDSKAMFGIDAKNISQNLQSHPLAYNLSSVGQGMDESSYYYSSINSNTKIVVQCIDASYLLANNLRRTQDDKFLSMILSGYRMNEETRKIVGEVNTMFDKPVLQNYFDSRSYVRFFMNNLLRPFLDNEVFSDNELDLYFPHVYTKDRHPNYPFKYKLDCSEYNFNIIPSQTLTYLNHFSTYFSQKNIKFYLLMMPVNPDLCPNPTISEESLKQLSEVNNLCLINSMKILDNIEFYDGVHANKKGAKKLSEFIAQQLSLTK